jgi:hypothetical protein
MKLIDFTKKTANESTLQKTLHQIQEQLPFLGKNTARVQRDILSRFQRGLDNRFTMIQNFTPQGSAKPVPFILVGPIGVVVFNLNMDKGVYRIKEETWQELNKTTRKYGLARVNLVKQTQDLAQTVGTLLVHKGQPVSEVMPVLLFGDSGVHVDSTRPAIRWVLPDGIDRLVASFQKGQEVLNPINVKAICDVFDAIAHPVSLVAGQEEDFFGKDLGLDVEKPKPKAPRPAPQINLPPAVKRVKFTRGQWIFLGAFLIINILLLMVAILVVVFTAG